MTAPRQSIRKPITSGFNLLVIFAVAVMALEPAHADWPQWRGPNRDGLVDSAPWPNSLDENQLKLKWKIPLARSYSGPLVDANTVYVTETRDQQFEAVQALDRQTGKPKWSQQWSGSMKVPFFARENGSWIRSTPALSDGRLYVGGMRDLLVCLDAATGERIWTIDFVDTFDSAVPTFGFVCSPLIVGPDLIVQAGGAVFKLDKATGNVRWKCMDDSGGMMGSAFSSPIMGKIHGKEQIFVQSRTTLAGVDLKSGEVLWSQEIPAFRGMNILTPSIINNRVFTSSYGGKSFLFSISANNEISETWTNKAKAYMSTPVVIDGHVYLHLANRRFTCIDLASGETKWTSKPYGKYASLVANGSQILALDQRGLLLLIEANPDEFKVVDQRELTSAETWAHLAVTDGQVFVRELEAMAVYDWGS